LYKKNFWKEHHSKKDKNSQQQRNGYVVICDHEIELGIKILNTIYTNGNEPILVSGK
jgi:hypothetical protein